MSETFICIIASVEIRLTTTYNIHVSIEGGDCMPRRTEAEIRIGDSWDPNANQRFRILKNKDNPGTFTVVEAKPEALKQSKDEGRDFNWMETTERDGLTAEQVGEILTSLLE